MRYRKVTAIIRRERLAEVEASLLEQGLGGITVTPVKGFGEYANYFRGDLMVPHVRLEIFTTAEKADATVETIVTAAYTGCAGDGLVAVLPVDRVVRIRTKHEADPETL